MKKLFFFAGFIFAAVLALSQETKPVASLDSFFAGISLKEGYTKWVEHINGNPDFGIDSINKNGIYSSIKAGQKNHFPFPDSVEVKFLLYTWVNIDKDGKYPPDTIERVIIEGVFGDKAKARRSSEAFLKQTIKELMKYYGHVNNFGSQYEFLKGINENFPAVLLENGFFPEKKFYYVLLLYDTSRRQAFKAFQ